MSGKKQTNLIINLFILFGTLHFLSLLFTTEHVELWRMVLNGLGVGLFVFIRVRGIRPPLEDPLS